jgi:hypothetical protein
MEATLVRKAIKSQFVKTCNNAVNNVFGMGNMCRECSPHMQMANKISNKIS